MDRVLPLLVWGAIGLGVLVLVMHRKGKGASAVAAAVSAAVAENSAAGGESGASAVAGIGGIHLHFYAGPCPGTDDDNHQHFPPQLLDSRAIDSVGVGPLPVGDGAGVRTVRELPDGRAVPDRAVRARRHHAVEVTP